ncbi:MAG: hypothetical protein WCR72_18810 [Bacteroidota bacterium]
MKKTFLTALSVFLFFLNGFCQEPSQAEIDKMVKDAQSMLSKFQQQGKDSSSLKTLPKKNGVIKPRSSIVPIHLTQPLKVPTEAQAKDHLLWYIGEKINDSMLVTTKSMVVLYSRKRDEVIAQPLKSRDPFRILVGNLSKAPQMTEDYVNKEVAKKNSFMNYPLIQMTVDEFNVIDDRLNDAVKNTIDLAALPASSAQTALPIAQTALEKPKGSEASKLPPKGNLGEMHRQLKQLLLNKPPMSFEPPPKKNFSLATLCDENAQKLYDAERKKWEDGFLAYERELIRKVFEIYRYFALTGTEPDPATSLENDLKEGFNLSISRSDEKIKLLLDQYGKDIFMQECVFTISLKFERQKQLLGIESGDMTVITDLLNGQEFENYMNGEIEKKNWDVIFNLSITLGRCRQMQLLGNDKTAERLAQLFERIMKLNRFALTAGIEFNIEVTDDDKLVTKASGKTETSQKTFVSLSRIGCKWTLLLSEPDYGNAKPADFYIPMKVTTGIKSVKDEKDQWNDYPYNGPKDMLLPLPVFRIDFSEGGQQDSATLAPARYLPDADLSGNIAEAYKADMLGFMNLVFNVASEEPGKSKDMMAVVNEMMGKIPQLTSMSVSSTPLEGLKNKYEMVHLKQEMEQKTAAASLSSKAVVLFNAVNYSSVLIDQTIDTKHKDGDIELTKGIIKIKVVHDPMVN